MAVKIENNYGTVSTPHFVSTNYKGEVLRTWNLNHIIFLRDGMWMGEGAYHRYEVVLSNGSVEQLTKAEYDVLFKRINGLK